jgi:hypothetical protein
VSEMSDGKVTAILGKGCFEWSEAMLSQSSLGPKSLVIGNAP